MAGARAIDALSAAEPERQEHQQRRNGGRGTDRATEETAVIDTGALRVGRIGGGGLAGMAAERAAETGKRQPRRLAVAKPAVQGGEDHERIQQPGDLAAAGRVSVR